MSNSTVVFYKLACVHNSCLDVFIDFTPNIAKKKHIHKTNCNNPEKNSPLYSTIRSNGGWNHWDIIKIGTELADDAVALLDLYREQYNHTLSNIDTPIEWKCECCNIIFPDNSHLKRHNKSEKHQIRYKNEEVHRVTNNNAYNNEKIDTQMVLELIEEKLSEKSIQTNNITTDNTNNTNNNNTNNNNTNTKFNLNFFLNDTCKNALTMDQFIEQIDLQVSDLEITGELGFAHGISRILTNKMKTLDVEQRPIHCSDVKRNILYIKNTDGWNRDDDRALIDKAIHDVARKNRKMVGDWVKNHPLYLQYDSKDNTAYMRMIGNAMVGGSDEEIRRNFRKVALNVARQSTIEKP
jgi:hypothetical protein